MFGNMFKRHSGWPELEPMYTHWRDVVSGMTRSLKSGNEFWAFYSSEIRDHIVELESAMHDLEEANPYTDKPLPSDYVLEYGEYIRAILRHFGVDSLNAALAMRKAQAALCGMRNLLDHYQKLVRIEDADELTMLSMCV